MANFTKINFINIKFYNKLFSEVPNGCLKTNINDLNSISEKN